MIFQSITTKYDFVIYSFLFLGAIVKTFMNYLMEKFFGTVQILAQVRLMMAFLSSLQDNIEYVISLRTFITVYSSGELLLVRLGQQGSISS